METVSEFSAWTGRGRLDQLVGELERQKEARIDFVTDTRSVTVSAKDGSLYLVPAEPRAMEWLPQQGLLIKDTALEQVGAKAIPPVPWRFLKELARERPVRAMELLNGLMQDSPGRRFIRCLDGHVRAVLSDRYRVLDHYDIAFAALDVVRAAGGEVIEASLSDTRMKLKFTTRTVWDAIDESRKGDPGSWYSGGLGNQEHLRRVSARVGDELPGGPGTVHPLVTVSNSETGHGGFGVRIGLLRAICFNLATVEDVVAKVHLGDRLAVGIFTEETVSEESKLIYLKARDAIRAAFHPETFARMVAIARQAQEDGVTSPHSAVQNVAKAVGLAEERRTALLGYFLREYDATRYGMAQAVARLAQDESDPDQAGALEDLAGAILRSRDLTLV
ncbi:MAG: hypothetical protein ACOYXR_06305 [Nitrospirota bacterium]